MNAPHNPPTSLKSPLVAAHVVLQIVLTCSLFVHAGHANATESSPLRQDIQTIDERKSISSTSLPDSQPRIQMAILLDTSSSMDGLIDQTRNQLWNVVNEFSTAKRGGVTPIFEVALFEYGNSGLSHEDGYIRKLTSFTRELDRVSEGLFSLKTNGGNEYCGMAIQSAVDSLQWSQAANDIKVIFIAGNEPFTQGPVNYRQSISKAIQRGIAVNTIYAGDFQTGINTGWQSGATLAGGDYMSIDANRAIVHIEAPQDKEIAELNNQLNKTYLPFGTQGNESAERQLKQDSNSQAISGGLLAKRVKSKASPYYDNRSWDLVDAVEKGSITKQELATLDKETLPKPMQEMSLEQQEDFIKTKAGERKVLQQRITRLSEERDLFVRKVKQAQSEQEQSASMNDALSQAIRKQASKQGFKLGGYALGKAE